jgi:LPS-assembly protein
VTGKRIDIQPGKYVIHQATATGCPAKSPDYRIGADKIEIWPDDQMILHNAKFYIRNQAIFSMSKYRTSLEPSDRAETFPFPRIGYRKSTGLYIRQHLGYPLSRTTSLFTNLNYYSKHHFKPTYGIRDRQRNYTTQITFGHFENDGDWIKKHPEFSWSYHARQIGSTPLVYQFGFSQGKWIDHEKTSWHQSYDLYLHHTPIRLDTAFLYLGAGVSHVREGYNKFNQNVPQFDATITKSFSPKLNTWASYHYKRYKTPPIFSYSIPDISQEINCGFTYKLDRLNTVGLTYRYDNEKRKLSDVYYTWYRNLHCWDFALTYKSKVRSWEWKVNLVQW